MEIPAKGWHGDLAPERLLQKGVLHGTKSCGRHVGDAGGGWRQTLLRHRWGRVKSGDRRATAQWLNSSSPPPTEVSVHCRYSSSPAARTTQLRLRVSDRKSTRLNSSHLGISYA